MSATIENGAVAVEQAHGYCARVTRVAAANFYYGIRLLPAGKRGAMCAVYAFARRIDDIGDGDLDRRAKLTALERELGLLRELRSPDAPRLDPVLVALEAAHRQFDLPLSALEDLIEGVRMDVLGSDYETFEQLTVYCRRVAGSIGRLCVAIFGSEDMPKALALADDLGVAMQLTNILRDLSEDAEAGRVYVPGADLMRYHLYDSQAATASQLRALARQASAADPDVVAGFGGGDVGQLLALMRFQALRAEEWFARGSSLLALLDRRSAACVSAMSGIYQRLLIQIQARPDEALAQRASLPARGKALVAITSLLAPRRGLKVA